MIKILASAEPSPTFTSAENVAASETVSPSNVVAPSTSKSPVTFKLLLTATSPSSASTVKNSVASLDLLKAIVLGVVL